MIVLVIIPYVLAASAGDYLNEFNNEGEICQVVDAFNYQIPAPIFFDSNNYASTVPVFYYCKANNSEIIIVFDIYNQKFYDDNTLSEAIDLGFIRYNLNTGTLKNTDFIHSGADVCSDIFGSEELNQQSVNLAAETAIATKPLLNPQTAKDVVTVIKLGKVAGKIGEFNPTSFIVSIGCSYNNKNLKQATEALALCNGYLTNIGNGLTRYGYVSELSSCILSAKTTLKGYIDSPLSQAREVADTLYAPIKALVIKPLSDAIQGKTPDIANIKIEESEMSIARRIYNDLGSNEANLNHPQKNTMIIQEKRRISEKQTTFSQALLITQNSYESTKKIQPSTINIWITSMFMTPNYNISTGIEFINNASNKINNAQKLDNQYRFNTAVEYLKLADTDINSSSEIFARENAIDRRTNWTSIIVSILLVIVVFFIIKKIVLDNQDRY
ncbi:hypothetical protein C4573_02210 [Candidatus Woesearchaeota archaeon]|nr:MAG: hypothetical protein C4573_02210 [Candidatus Woesearchaeota archaeon]